MAELDSNATAAEAEVRCARAKGVNEKPQETSSANPRCGWRKLIRHLHCGGNTLPLKRLPNGVCARTEVAKPICYYGMAFSDLRRMFGVKACRTSHLQRGPHGLDVQTPAAMAMRAAVFVRLEAHRHIRGRQQELF